MLALGLAIFLVYIVMASQFESLIHPFVILFTIPLAIIGVIIFLYIFKIPLSIVVFLGLIMLAGIVVNNAIVLVDYINHLRDSGISKMDAIIKGGQVRLRPILMTTSTTVLGLLPMALGLGDGAEIRTPMAVTVIVGLTVSTVLTLIVIPIVYSLFAKEKTEPVENGEVVFGTGK
jgi:HAE1 family hydrophobic/amphiphilic exporter-1